MVAAGKAISAPVADAAVTTKMIRVILLAPFLLLLSAWWGSRGQDGPRTARAPLAVPWFAFGFIVVALFNSLRVLPEPVTQLLLNVGNVFMAMAMAALGLTTHYRTVQQAGVKQLLLGGLLMLWLVLGGGLLQILMN